MIGAKERSNPWYLRTSSPSLINPYSQEVLELPQRQTSSAVYKLGVCVHPFRQNPPLPASTEIILGPAHSVWKHLQTAWSCQRTLLKQLGWGSPVCECSKAKGLQVSAPSCTIKLDGMIWYVYCMSTPGKKHGNNQRGASLIVNSSQVSPNNTMGKDSQHLETQQLYTARSSLLNAKSWIWWSKNAVGRITYNSVTSVNINMEP